MTTQSLLFGWLIATACGLLYHFIRGGRLRRMLLYLVSAWVAFFVGHWIGGLLKWTALRLGPLNLLPALLGTLLGLIAADVLAGSEARFGKDRLQR
ncbi:MAG: hypothetical protein AB1449_05205 [Chloroflexota bacterium]